MNSIYYTTVDKHRLHIADENSHYGGSINSYNNFLTRFFAKIFGKSMKVNMDGKTRTVNKKNYEKFLSDNGIQANKNNIHMFKNFKQAMAGRTRDWGHCDYMRNHLSRSKSNKLFQKLVYAIQKGHLEKAKNLAGKGADVEKVFWERNGHGITFSHLTSNLPDQPLNFRATRYNPILYAAMKGHVDLTRFLKQIGSSTNFQGETVQFRRMLTHVENRPVIIYYGNTPHVEYETIENYADGTNKLSTHYLHEENGNLNVISLMCHSCHGCHRH